jgi:hypothetical protein
MEDDLKSLLMEDDIDCFVNLTTWKMEDDHNYLLTGRRPQLLGRFTNERQP